MDRQTRRLFLGAIIVLAVIVAGISLLGGPGPSPDGLGPTPAHPDAPTVDGIVVKVDSAGLAAVASFTLRTDDGQLLVFDVAQLRNGVQFPPGHLAEHQATSQRVRVWYSQSPDGGRHALWLEDVAPG